MRLPARLLVAAWLLSFASCTEEPPPPPPVVPEVPAPKPPRPPATDGAVPTDAGVDAGDGGEDGGGDAGPGDGGADAASSDGGAALDAWADVRTKPAGAEVFVDEQASGTSPAKVPVASGAKHVVKLLKPGYFPEARELAADAGETVAVDVTLRPGATLRVTSDPPDASVSVNGALVLAATPGVTAAFEPNRLVEVTVALPGHDPFSKKLKVRGEQKLDVKLTPSIQVGVTSSPTGAEVSLDGKPLGVTPVDVWLSSRGKHTLVVSKAGWSTVKKVLSGPQAEVIHVVLSDVELEKFEADVAAALKAYDRADEALQRAQADPSKEERLTAAEAAMEKATSDLEEAERQLAAAKAKRAR